MNKIIERTLYLKQLEMWLEKDIIKVVTGVRRSGKSTLLELFINFLKKKDISDEQIIYVHLDYEENSHLLNHKSLHNYISSKILKNKRMYLFIDEVQNCTDYEKAISSIHLNKMVDIYITGSNAYMLSGELATKLTGRYIEISMLPLSFVEYGKIVSISNQHSLFNDYMNYGAFPFAATLVENSLMHSQYLQGVYTTVMVKDILTRKRITDSALLESIIRFLCSNMGSPVSAKKIADTLTSSGRPVGSTTVDTYLEAICDAYLFYKVQRYDIKGKMNLKTEPKYYICDTGIRNVVLSIENKDIGHILENIVYLELLRRGYIVSIGKAGRTEIDFVVSKNKQIEYYQVSASVLDKGTLAREIEPFNHIKDNYPKFLITMDNVTSDHNGIKQFNVISWLQKE
ncbi:MAG: ATP-binding protein [Endomicrobium sp.]|nr:ATP-binding protein [Endomicrobium sp.]